MANKKATKSTQVSNYSASELAEGALQIFGVQSECVLTALQVAGKKYASIEEAKKIITTFMKKEVI